MRVAIFDYGAGNLHSIAKAIAGAGVDVVVETDPLRATSADALVLPGVGAFGPAARRIAPGAAAIRKAISDGLPAIGICLGMQLLFDGSDESEGAGLGVLPGRVRKLAAHRVPQIGWNSIDESSEELVERSELRSVYYANSYVCRPADTAQVTAWSTHEGDRFPAVVRAGAVMGVQFHPEKSSAAGVRFLHEFLDGARR